MHSDRPALVLLEEVSRPRARQGERWWMVVERVALRAEAAAMETLDWVREERYKLIASMQEERCRVREAEAWESAGAEIRRLRAEVAAMETQNWLQEERCKLVASMQEERCGVREAEAAERKQSAEAELQRLSCWKQNVEADLQEAEAERKAEAEEDAKLIGCLKLQVDAFDCEMQY
jgi:hypothetical protein